ncbi:beta-lactamase family protein [candidate division KSB1 bacterium]|nr:beta-lactamase family protein [candidate division KSB1 bacterium]
MKRILTCRIITTFFLFFLVLFVGLPFASAQNYNSDLDKKLDRLRDYVNSIMEDSKVPGLALGIVMDGEVVFAEGFGYRDKENGLPVTAQTLFAIGSCTKAFTTAALGILNDDDVIDWDEPVRTYLPSFRLKAD